MKTLLAMMVAVFALSVARPTEAGCALTVTFTNEFDRAITVSQLDAKTVPVGSYATVWTGSVNVPAGEHRSVAVELKMGCAAGLRMFRAKYARGSESGWQTKGPVSTALDHKINIRFK